MFLQSGNESLVFAPQTHFCTNKVLFSWKRELKSIANYFSKMILVGYLNAANEYYSTASHHEQKNHKTTGQIKFLAVTIKKHIKPSYNILYVNRYYV